MKYLVFVVCLTFLSAVSAYSADKSPNFFPSELYVYGQGGGTVNSVFLAGGLGVASFWEFYGFKADYTRHIELFGNSDAHNVAINGSVQYTFLPFRGSFSIGPSYTWGALEIGENSACIQELAEEEEMIAAENGGETSSPSWLASSPCPEYKGLDGFGVSMGGSILFKFVPGFAFGPYFTFNANRKARFVNIGLEIAIGYLVPWWKKK